MALTLPDACGKLAYPQSKTNKERYIKWFDEYANICTKFPDYIIPDLPHMDGKVLYKIRCSFLHESSNDLGEEFNLNKFLFIWNGACGESGLEYLPGNKKRRYWYVNARLLTMQIINGVEDFLRNGNYNKNDLPVINEYGIEDCPDIIKIDK